MCMCIRLRVVEVGEEGCSVGVFGGGEGLLDV